MKMKRNYEGLLAKNDEDEVLQPVEGNGVLHTSNSLLDVIECVVTNNLGYDPIKRSFFAWLRCIDCRGLSYEEAKKVNPNKTNLSEFVTYDQEHTEMHEALHEMDDKRVISSIRDEISKKTPAISRHDGWYVIDFDELNRQAAMFRTKKEKAVKKIEPKQLYI